MEKEFSNGSTTIVTLGLTTYLLGIASGTLIVAPLSEMYGRKKVYLISMFISMLLVLPCALATTLTEVMIVRFFGAFAGASLIANSPGSIGDVTTDEYRSLVISIWSIGPFNGPVVSNLAVSPLRSF